MNTPSWVIDTNVIVSGLLSAQQSPARLVDAVLSGVLRICFDDRIEAEYREVLSRPKFDIPVPYLEAFLGELRNQDLVTARPWTGPTPPDPDDVPFLEVALLASDRILVTGNQRHFPKSCCGSVRVLTPRAAWAKLTEN